MKGGEEMEIHIKGSPEEIAALVVGLQGRHESAAVDGEQLVKSIIRLQGSRRERGKPASGQSLQIPE